MTSKADKIRALYDGERSTREIARMVGCDPAYVRVVARQRVPSVPHAPAYQNYRPRQQELARIRYRKTVDAFGTDAARKAGRAAYHAVCEAGGSIREAGHAYRRAYATTIWKLARLLP